MTQRASGWYDDPENPDQLRYWDGILWSKRTMPKVKPGLDRSSIGDAKRLWEEEQERKEAALQAQQQQTTGTNQRPTLSPYQDRSANPYQSDPQQRRDQLSGYGPGRYPAPVTTRTTPDGEPAAAWWRRLVALIIDNLLLFAVAVAVSWHWLSPWVSVVRDWSDEYYRAAQANSSRPAVPDEVGQIPWQYAAILAVLYLVYETCLVAWCGQTIGKMLLGIRVRRSDSTAQPAFGTAVTRAVVKGIPVLTFALPLLSTIGSMFGLVDGLIPLRQRYAQSIHDMSAHTYVVPAKTVTHQQGGPQPPLR